MKRREFIILTGVGATSSTLLSACGHPEEKLIPALIPDDQYVPGVDYWKASTCGMCHAGCGIIVRTREHKANKIEGNPLHPVNRGALCARGQAGLEVLYNPDRLKGPMKRVGERGEGKWEEISWDEAIKTLSDKLREINPNSTTDKASFYTSDSGGVTAQVAGRFMQASRQTFVAAQTHGAMELEGIYADLLRGVVKPGEAIPDIANATYLLSLGARFLETWKSPVMCSQAYGEFRSARGKTRGRFVHIEPRMSLTAANADEWIAAVAGTEALVVMAIIQVIVREKLNKAPVSVDSARMLEEFSPESTTSSTDVPTEKIIRIAREFAGSERPLAIGNLRTPSDSAIHLLNAIVENLNKPGGILLFESPDKSNDPLKVPGDGLILPGETNDQLDKRSTREGIDIATQRSIQIASTRYRVIMIHGFNPMFDLRGWSEELQSDRFIVSFSSFMDETSEMADLILPDHTCLERWDLQSSYGADGSRVFSLTQPVIEPQLNTRQTSDVLLGVARELGGEVSKALPFDSAKDIIEKGVEGFVKGEKAESAWSALIDKGLVSTGPPTPVKAQTAEGSPMSLDTFYLRSIRNNASVGSTNAEYPLSLVVYEHAAFGDGSAANLPSIQELPDQLTSVMWGSWIEINPKTAASMGLADGDLVEVSTTNGSLRAPAILYPAIRPDTVAIPMGQGHTSFGRYARGRGANPALLVGGAFRGKGDAVVSARVTRVGGRAELIRFGTELMEHMESKR